jgi:hypothetical protein
VENMRVASIFINIKTTGKHRLICIIFDYYSHFHFVRIILWLVPQPLMCNKTYVEKQTIKRNHEREWNGLTRSMQM